MAYFDGPGGTQVPRVVAEAMVDYLFHHNANTHWAYPSSAETDQLILEARQAGADLFGCRADEVAFGQNMTTLTFHLARGLGRQWGRGDEIVLTELDHHANRAPWEDLVAERDVTVRLAPFDPATGELDLEALGALIGPRTRMVAVGAASNALGTISDVTTACRWARERGALSFVDAVHLAPHALIDVEAIGCDFLACSPYKFYGPHLGMLFGRRELLEAVEISRLAPAPPEAPDRIETGTLSHEAICGARAAIDFLAGLAGPAPDRRAGLARSFRALHAEGEQLFARMWTGLGAVPGLQLYGPPPGSPRTPTLGFTLKGRSAESVAAGLAAQGVFASHGDFYAATVIERLRVEGLIRAGAACYTSMDEVERLVDAVGRIG